MTRTTRPGAHKRERGAMMMFVLIAALLLGMITLGVMRLVAGDTTEGLGGLDAVQAFNVAEAGVHYAIGKLQASGAITYPGETIPITSGPTTLGTATIQVNCIDTGGAPPCSGTYAGYRRIVSTSTLPSSGPTRTLVAVVQATSGSNPSGLCGTGFPGYHGVQISGEENGIHSNIGSNTDIYVGVSENPGYTILADTASPPAYTGQATYMTSIYCGGVNSGFGGCPAQVQGGTSQSTTQVCPPVTFPSGYWGSGGSNLTVGCGGSTINSTSGFNFNNINVPVIAQPNAPTVTVVGATGITAYSYYVVAVDICGNRSLASPVTQITNGNATLSVTNYNQITWTAVTGAISYNVLKNTTNALLGNTSATMMQDIGQSTTSFSNSCTYNDLKIQADPSNPNATQVVYVNGDLAMGACTRLIILGVGKVDLRFGKSTGQELIGGTSIHFGVLSTDTQSTPAPIPANRFTVDVNSSAYGSSSSAAAVYFQSNSIIAGTFNVPNGEMYLDGGGSGLGTFYGAINAGMIYIGIDMYSDTSGSSGSTWSNFTNLRSWKDQ